MPALFSRYAMADDPSRHSGAASRGYARLASCIALWLLVGMSNAGAQGVSDEYATALVVGGDVSVVRVSQPGDSRKLSLRAGERVGSGDTLITGLDGRLQIRFTDGGIVSLQPNTEFHIDDYRNSDSTQRSWFSLLRGAIRTTTGSNGKRDHDDYRMRTPTATIGVRGTAYSAEQTVCEPSCSPGPAAGLRVAVSEGRIIVINQGGLLELERGQAAAAGSRDAIPFQIDTPPELAPQTRDATPAAGKQAAAEAASSGSKSDSRSAASVAAASEPSDAESSNANSGAASDASSGTSGSTARDTSSAAPQSEAIVSGSPSPTVLAGPASAGGDTNSARSIPQTPNRAAAMSPGSSVMASGDALLPRADSAAASIGIVGPLYTRPGAAAGGALVSPGNAEAASTNASLPTSLGTVASSAIDGPAAGLQGTAGDLGGVWSPNSQRQPDGKLGTTIQALTAAALTGSGGSDAGQSAGSGSTSSGGADGSGIAGNGTGDGDGDGKGNGNGSSHGNGTGGTGNSNGDNASGSGGGSGAGTGAPDRIAAGQYGAVSAFHVSVQGRTFLGDIAPNSVRSFTIDEQSRLTSVQSCSLANCVTLRAASFAEGREAGSDPYVSWGRWTGGSAELTVAGIQAGMAPLKSIQYLVGAPTPIMPTSGMFTYNLIGATAPTLSGSVESAAGVFNATAAVAFGTGLTTRVGLDGTVSMPGTALNPASVYTFTTNGGLTSPANSSLTMSGATTFQGNLTAQQSGGTPIGCAAHCAMSVNGAFYGPEAARAGINYSIQGTAGRTIDGVGVFGKVEPNASPRR